MIAQKLRQKNNAAVRRNMMMYIVQYWVTFTSHIIPKFHSMLPHFGKIITLFPQSFCLQHRDSLKEILRKLHFRFAHSEIHSKRLKLCTSGLKYIRKPRQNERIVAHSKHSSFLIRNLHFAKNPALSFFRLILQLGKNLENMRVELNFTSVFISANGKSIQELWHLINRHIL